MPVTLATRRRVGATKLELPVFGFGGAHLGELYARIDEAQSRATLDGAWAAGVRYYDTAPEYGRGLSEHRIGGLLRTQPRDAFVVNTKVGRILTRPAQREGFKPGHWAGGLPYDIVFDYSYDGIMRAYEQSLQRLALNRIDSLVIHDADASYHAPDVLAAHRRTLADSGMRALEELKAAGDIAAIGVGNNLPGDLDAMLDLVEVDFALVALPYTLLDQSTLHTSMANCLRRGVSVVIGAPFASGILVTGSGAGAKYAYGAASPEIQARVRHLEQVSAAHGVALSAAALQFPLAHPAVVAVIPGAVRPEEVKANIAALEAPIPAAFWSDLRSQGLIPADAPVPAD